MRKSEVNQHLFFYTLASLSASKMNYTADEYDEWIKTIIRGLKYADMMVLNSNQTVMETLATLSDSFPHTGSDFKKLPTKP